MTRSSMNEVQKSYDLKCPNVGPGLDGEEEDGKWGKVPVN